MQYEKARILWCHAYMQIHVDARNGCSDETIGWRVGSTKKGYMTVVFTAVLEWDLFFLY